MELLKIVKKEKELLSEFRKFLAYEKGYVLSQTEKYIPNIQNLSKQEIENILVELALENLPSYKLSSVVWYLAFLTSIYEYIQNLKKLEYWQNDNLLSFLKSERKLSIALKIKKEAKRGRKPKKRQKLEKLKGEILHLKQKGIGTTSIVKYLAKVHKFKVSEQYLAMVLKEWQAERLP